MIKRPILFALSATKPHKKWAVGAVVAVLTASFLSRALVLILRDLTDAIAHRLSTLKKMDRIVTIEEGKIVEDGTPDKLLKLENGVFKKLWDHQISGFIVDQ